MIEITEKLKLSLNKFNIQEYQYIDSQARLIALGFSKDDSDKIILREESGVIVNEIIGIVGRLKSLFSLPEIIRIAARPTGAECLWIILKHFEDLKGKGFSAKEIVSMSMHEESDKIISVLIKHYQFLSMKGYTPTQILSMVTAILKHYQFLNMKGYTSTQIASMASHDEGSKNLGAVSKYHQALTERGYTPTQIASIAYIGGSKNLKAALVNPDVTDFFEFDDEWVPNDPDFIHPFEFDLEKQNYCEPNALLQSSMINITDNIKSKLNKLSIQEHKYIDWQAKLMALGFSKNNSDKIILRKKSSVIINKIIEIIDSLKSRFSLPEITKIAARPHGAQCLLASLNHFEGLIDKGFSVEEIVSMSAHKGSDKTISELIKNYKELRQLPLSNQQLVSLISHEYCSNHITSILKYYQLLSMKGYISTQIASMASHAGGSKNIEAVLKYHYYLTDKGYTSTQIEKMASRPYGSKNIANIIDSLEQQDCFEPNETIPEDPDTYFSPDTYFLSEFLADDDFDFLASPSPILRAYEGKRKEQPMNSDTEAEENFSPQYKRRTG